MQDDSRQMQEKLANKFAQLKDEALSREKLSVERALEPFVEEIRLLNDGSLSEKLINILEEVTRAVEIEGDEVLKSKSQYYDLVFGEFEFPLINIAETRSKLVNGSRPWSKSWIGLRAGCGKLNRKMRGIPSVVGLLGYSVGMVSAVCLGALAFVEISVVLSFLAFVGVFSGGIFIPAKIAEDSVIVDDISNITIEGTDTLKQKLLDCGFESRAKIKGSSINKISITIQTRYTPAAQDKLTLQ